MRQNSGCSRQKKAMLPRCGTSFVSRYRPKGRLAVRFTRKPANQAENDIMIKMTTARPSMQIALELQLISGIISL